MELIINTPGKTANFAKLAAHSLPKDPSLWQADILKKLVMDHPYLPINDAQVIFRKVDPTKGAALGAIVLGGGKISIPILIKTPTGSNNPKLEPLDVFFNKGMYRPLTRSTIKSIMFNPKIGEPIRPTTQNVRGANPYIGDVTGDASPLEFTGQPSPYAGPYDAVKLSSAMFVGRENHLKGIWSKKAPFITKISVDENSLAQLKNMLKSQPSILHSARGQKDLLQKALRKDPDVGAERIVPDVPSMVQVLKGPAGGYFIKFLRGPATKVSTEELRTIFRDRLPKILSIVDQYGRWVGIENIIFGSYAADSYRRTQIKPIRTDGYFIVATQDGGGVRGHVARVVVTPAGEPVEMRLFVGDDGSYGFSDHMYGRVLTDHNILPIGQPAVGKKGTFVHYSFGSPTATVPVQINRLVTAGSYKCFIVSDLLHGKSYALVPLREITDFAPSPIVPEEIKTAAGNLPVVYIPGEALFTELKRPINIAQSLSDLTKVSNLYQDAEPRVRITFGGGLFTIDGEVWKKTAEWPLKRERESVSKDFLNEDTLYEELIGFGVRPADVFTIEKTCEKKGELIVTDLTDSQWKETDKPSLQFTSAQPETIEFINALKPNILKEAAETEDRDTIDAALSLEMLNTDNIQHFLDYIGEFEQVTEKLANLLVISRLGLKPINQMSVKKAMLGMSDTIEKLRTLQSQVESPDQL